MKQKLLVALLMGAFVFPSMSHARQEADCKSLEKIFHTKAETDDGICKLEIVRKNKQITHQGQAVKPDMIEFVYHISFQKKNGSTKVLGEMALLEQEINSVIDELRKGSIEISAIHNHWIGEHSVLSTCTCKEREKKMSWLKQ
jgi:hypothetical protein